MTFTRELIKLEPGEAQPEPKHFEMEPPEGFRWETDVEFRERMLRSVPKSE